MKIYDMKTQPAKSEYKGSGWAWAAMKDDQIVAIRYMHDHTGCFTGYCAEALHRANRTRYCKASERAAQEMNREAFTAWRNQARSELAEMGTVVSGMMSCWHFEITSNSPCLFSIV